MSKPQILDFYFLKFFSLVCVEISDKMSTNDSTILYLKHKIHHELSISKKGNTKIEKMSEVTGNKQRSAVIIIYLRIATASFIVSGFPVNR